MGVTVTFIAVLELMREGLIDIVQAEPFAPLHVRAAAPRTACCGWWRTTKRVGDGERVPQAAAAVEDVVEDRRPGKMRTMPR